MQSEGVAHANVLGKIGYLAPHVVLRHKRAARVRAQTHLDTGFQRRTSTLDNARAHDVTVLLLRIGRMGLFWIEQYKRQRRADSAGHARRTPLELRARGATVQPQDLGRHRGTVLDRIDAGLKRSLHAFGALDMGHNRQANLVRRLARRRGNLDRHAQHARLAHLGSVEHAARHEQLDDIGTARMQVSHLLGCLDGAVGHLGEQARAMAARHRDARSRRYQARTLILAGVDSVAHGNVSKQRVARAAHRGHAACQLLLGTALKNVAHDGAPHGIIELLHQRARIAGRDRLARAAQVHVHIDETGHEICTCQVDNLGACRRLRHSTWPHPGDDAALNSHGHIGLRLHMLRTIQDGRIDKQRGTIGRRHIELLPLRKLQHLSIITQCSGIAADISVNGERRRCGERNALQSHPSDIREMSRSVTGRPGFSSQMLQIEIFRHCVQPLSQSVTVRAVFGR